jgi:hypothetical protein
MSYLEPSETLAPVPRSTAARAGDPAAHWAADLARLLDEEITLRGIER